MLKKFIRLDLTQTLKSLKRVAQESHICLENMSPRTDSYLSICLEQATNSPLHYRHGCIIVSGGKIIGQGYNHYRPGFNGGALKTGQLKFASAISGPAISALKKKQRQERTKDSSKQDTETKQQESSSSLTSSILDSSSGGSYTINTPLSMHSEMMAIHSALSAPGTMTSRGSARITRWLEKPCLKLPSGSKRQLRLRGLKSYVEAVCGEQAVPPGGKIVAGGQ